jgi:anti-sigma-K factor RskA
MNEQGTSNGHEQYRDDVAAYVLGALEESELEEFQHHLAGCASCREEVSELRVVADSLPAATTPVEPSPQLRARLMATVRAEADLLRASGAAADAVPSARRRRWRPVLVPRPALALAGAAIAALGASVGVFALTGSENGGQTSAARVNQALAPGARASLFVAGGRAQLRVANLPAPTLGRIYEMWVQRPGHKPQPAHALFSLRNGAIDVPGNLNGSLRGVKAIMVTDEPLPFGSRQPTMTPIIVATVA